MNDIVAPSTIGGFVPQIDVSGTAVECGEALGHVWRDTLHLGASRVPADSKPWWKDKRYAKLMNRLAPHLPDVYCGMARTSGVSEDLISTRSPIDAGGCTSFAIAPKASLEGNPISGQTKDTPIQRMHQFQVLRMKMSNAPSTLTLTYAGWIFGHGFVEGRCAIFRNSLFAAPPKKGLKYGIWGMLALHCRSVDEVIELTKEYGVDSSSHMTVADAVGGIVGIEATEGGLGFLKPKRDIYTHANVVCASKRLGKTEKDDKHFTRADSLNRQDRMRAQFEPDRGRLTAPLAMQAMSDHVGYPKSICRHESAKAMTTAAVVVEPTRGLMHVTKGNPCRNWPRTYTL